MPEPDFVPKRLSRSVYIERTVDAETGAEEVSENTRDLVEGWDGTLETVSSREARAQACGHVWQPGQSLARCEMCSKKAGKTVFVCEACSVTCGMCGMSLCLRHTKPAPDGNRYCKKCHRKVLRQLHSEQSGAKPSLTGRTGLLGRILEWW